MVCQKLVMKTKTVKLKDNINIVVCCECAKREIPCKSCGDREALSDYMLCNKCDAAFRKYERENK